MARPGPAPPNAASELAASPVGQAAGASARDAVVAPVDRVEGGDRMARRRLARWMAALGLLGVLAGLMTGSEGLSPGGFFALLHSDQAGLILGEIRAPRTLGAALVGALLGLGGAVAQGLFRNPLADPYLLGSAAGAALAVVAVLAAASLGGVYLSLDTAAWLDRVGLVLAAFGGALGGVLLTLALARGAVQTLRLLLAGVVVAVLLNALGEGLTVVAPDALRGRQAFLLGSTSFMSASSLWLLAIGGALLLALALRLARALDALTLGEDSAISLGLDLGRLRLYLVAVLAGATALAVSQAGLLAFVGLVAPHLVRRHAPGAHRWLLVASAGMGALLLLAADVLSRALIAPQELPVGIVTAVVGGVYLFVLLRRRVSA